MTEATLDIVGREVSLSNLDRILWPEPGYTKKDLIAYYSAVFPYMAPHLARRPLVFTRYPGGINSNSFYQKNAPANLPEWFQTYAWTDNSGKSKNYVLVNTAADLVWLANQACLEIHPWMSQIDSIEYPDFIVFDLDPSEDNTFTDVVTIAKLLKQLLDELGLRTYPKTSGSLGLHIYLPVVNRYSYDQVRKFGHAIAAMICKILPDNATIERSVRSRGPRIYVDYLQNGLGKTVCAPYSVRPRPQATVSAPFAWQELDSIAPIQFTIKTMPGLLARRGDLFSEVLSDRQELEPTLKMLGISI
ncbi:MAG: DNA polymerase domain-containing protein [Syntrophomonadaceae bacterium]|nr:DNA polymerase domain-containing protein [Syntrophomonadaceae bacterium]